MEDTKSTGLLELLNSNQHYANKYKECLDSCKKQKTRTLKSKYPREFNSWKDRKSWAKRNAVEWHTSLNSFTGFLTCIGPIPNSTEDWTLHRAPHFNGSYIPNNLQWADKKTQSAERTSARLIKYQGKALSINEISEKSGMTYDAVRVALNRHGDSHATTLIEKANTPENSWTFPDEIKTYLEDRYLAEKTNEFRIRWFVRTMKSEYMRNRFKASLTTNLTRSKILEEDCQELRALHNQAIDFLRQHRVLRRQHCLYDHIQAPADAQAEAEEGLDLTGASDPRYF